MQGLLGEGETGDRAENLRVRSSSDANRRRRKWWGKDGNNQDSISNKNAAITVTHSHQRQLRNAAMKAEIKDQIKRKMVLLIGDGSS